MPPFPAIAEAAALLRAGALVAFPTETVYGLGADAADDRAVAAIYAAKGRPSFNPLIVHVAEAGQLDGEVVWNAAARRLARRFWPGPLTLVLPRRPESRLSPLCSAGLDSLAVRMPAHPLARALLQAAGRPLAAPSANRSGRVSPTTAAHVRRELGGRAAMILDGGPCAIGLESSVLDLSGAQPRLLRAGGLPRQALERELGPLASRIDNGRPLSPGQLPSHYAPSLPLRLNARTVAPDEALLAFGTALSGAADSENLSPGGDLTEAAARLFAALHRLDRPGFAAIAVMPIPMEGLGEAINDRLIRAAAPRPLDRGWRPRPESQS